MSHKECDNNGCIDFLHSSPHAGDGSGMTVDPSKTEDCSSVLDVMPDIITSCAGSNHPSPVAGMVEDCPSTPGLSPTPESGG
jgi:hypothetical protein